MWCLGARGERNIEPQSTEQEVGTCRRGAKAPRPAQCLKSSWTIHSVICQATRRSGRRSSGKLAGLGLAWIIDGWPGHPSSHQPEGGRPPVLCIEFDKVLCSRTGLAPTHCNPFLPTLNLSGSDPARWASLSSWPAVVGQPVVTSSCTANAHI